MVVYTNVGVTVVMGILQETQQLSRRAPGTWLLVPSLFPHTRLATGMLSLSEAEWSLCGAPSAPPPPPESHSRVLYFQI